MKTMKTDIGFLFGLLVYVRIFSLSLDRIHENFSSQIVDFIEKSDIPFPSAIQSAIKSEITKKSIRNPIKGFFDKKHAKLTMKEYEYLSNTISALNELISGRCAEKNEQNISVRLRLSTCEEILRRIIGKKSKDSDYVDHLGSSSFLELKSFREIVGPNWP